MFKTHIALSDGEKPLQRIELSETIFQYRPVDSIHPVNYIKEKHLRTQGFVRN